MEGGDYFTEEELTQADSELLHAPTDGRFIDDVKSLLLKAGNINRKLDHFKKEFEHERKSDAEWRSRIDTKLDLLMSAMGCREGSQEMSESILAIGSGSDSSQFRKATPFVSISYKDGKSEDIYLPSSVARDVMSCSKIREMVRKLLLHIHDQDIAFLRKCTRSGKSAVSTTRKRSLDDSMCSEDGTEDSSRKEKLPLRTQLIIFESVRKYMPIDAEVMKIPKMAEKELAEQIKKTKEAMTDVLNYFQGNYDANGKIIPNSSSKKARTMISSYIND